MITRDDAVRAFRLYLTVLRECDLPMPSEVDVDHSGLLCRCLSGEPVFPFQPPKSFSRPDYDLAEGKLVLVHDLFEEDESLVANQYRYQKTPDPTIVVDSRSGLRFVVVLTPSTTLSKGVIFRADVPTAAEKMKWRCV